MKQHPSKPPRGSAEHFAWVLRRFARNIDEGIRPTRDAFVEREKERFAAGDAPHVTSRDIRYAGGMAALREAHARRKDAKPNRGVDISGLDWDEDADTAPGGTVPPLGPAASGAPVIETTRRAAPKPPPRPAEPREVLAARRDREAKRVAEAKVKALAEELEQAEARGELLDALYHAGPLIPVVPREPTSGLREAAAFLACSDWHVEEMVDPSTIEYKNAYTPRIAKRRIERLAMGTLWLTEMHRERFLIRDLVLWLGGDLLSGFIHEELEETNAMSPPEAVVWLEAKIGGFIQTLLDKGGFERILIPCNTGNHGRTTRRKRHKTSVRNSYEYIVYCHLAQRFKDDPRVQFEIARGAHVYTQVYDTRLRLHHGDDVRYYGGVGGLSIPLNKATSAWQKFKPVDLTVIGHYHQLLHGRDWIVNGSLVGYNEFALSIKAEYEDPAQAYFLIDKHRGRTCASPVWVEERGVDWAEEWKRG